MPLIPYPDIPLLAGVPALARRAGQTIASPQIQSASVAKNLGAVKWGIFDASGNEVLIPDSFIDFEYKNERKIPTYPIEEGSFASYNKVSVPYDLRLTVTCGGKDSRSREGFLGTIEDMMASINVYNIVTPNANYQGASLVHYDYRREARQGLSLLIVQLWFQEVRVAQPSTPTTAQPSGASLANNGQVSPIPSTSQAAEEIGT